MEIQTNTNSIPATYNKQGSTYINRSSTKNKPSWCKEFYTAEEFNAKVNNEIQHNAHKKITIEQQEILFKMLNQNIFVNVSK